MRSSIEHRSRNVVLVATDFSSSAAMALERAARLPPTPGATLHVLHVLPGRLPAKLRAPAEVEARRLLEESSTAASIAASKAGSPKLQILPALTQGQAYVEIIQEARRRKANLIVIGRHGKRPIRDLFIGSTAERVVREGDRPVLVVNLKPARPYRRPLIAVELAGAKHTAQRIIALALRLVDPAVARLLLIHAFDVPFEGRMRSALTHDALIDYRREWKKKAARDLQRLQNGLELPGGAHLKTLLRSGDPRTVILHEATRRHVDLITLGTHGRSGIAHALLGCVAASVLRAASCDVAVERTTGITFEAP